MKTNVEEILEQKEKEIRELEETIYDRIEEFEIKIKNFDMVNGDSREYESLVIDKAILTMQKNQIYELYSRLKMYRKYKVLYRMEEFTVRTIEFIKNNLNIK